MISEALRVDIEVWASKKHEKPLVAMAKAGTLTKAMVTRYVANVTYLVQRTPGHLRLAIARARHLGDERLARHFEHKLEEEDGHFLWGEDDLRSLHKVGVVPVATAVTSAIADCSDFLMNMIERDPALYLTHLAFTEYVTVLLGPELLSDIEGRCGVPKTSMSIIDKHIDLDRDHAEEGFDIIDDLVRDPRKITSMRRALADIMAHFDRFAAEVVREVDVDEESDDIAYVHVSAA